MARIHIPKLWQLPESAATDESIYRGRRAALKKLGLGAGALLAAPLLSRCSGGGGAASDGGVNRDRPSYDGPIDWVAAHAAFYPATRNESYAVPERDLTPELAATTYNNFYEFTVNKNEVHELARDFITYPWSVSVGGLVEKPQVYDFDALVRQMDLEERIYRHRCVETWAMTVPWTGFPFSRFIELVKPLSSARHVRLVTLEDAAQFPGYAQDWFPWPYFEGLRLDEAMNELTLFCTGLYGKPLPPQNGAPLRVIVPWKYGYKSIKSVVHVEFTAEQPSTFWNSLAPEEYGYLSNVDPDVPHPRWSQAEEWLLDSFERVPTQKYNGYGPQVAALYK